MSSHLPTQQSLDGFLRTFGDPDAVRIEIRKHWAERGHITTPVEVYNHLIELRVADGRISAVRGDELQQIFRDSFSPEHTTGYNHKHRLPLMDGLAGLYMENFLQRPLYRAEGDIGNLGGLNRAMQASAAQLHRDNPSEFARQAAQHGISGQVDAQISQLARIKADAVVGTITGIAQSELGDIAHVQAVRKGGDEVAFILQPRDGQTLETIQQRLRQAEQRIGAFTEQAGLSNIAHLKYDDPAKAMHYGGVSIGLGAEQWSVQALTQDAPQMQARLETQIATAKTERALSRSAAGFAPDMATIPDIATVDRALDANSAVRAHPVGENYRVVIGRNTDTPDQALQRQIVETLERSDGPLSEAERQAANGTHALVRKRDNVTGMPIFGNMQGEQFTHFMGRYGEAHGGARLVHIDFSNMAGGNQLGSAVGDAMGLEFAGALRRGLADVNMAQYEPYIATTTGGRFALLLPGDTSPEKLSELHAAINRQIEAASHKALNLHPYEEEVALRHAAQRGIPHHDGALHMADFANPKSGLTGVDVHIAMSETPIRSGESVNLGAALRPLERATEASYQQTVRQRLQRGDTHEPRTTPHQPGNTDGPPAGRRTADAEAPSGRASAASQPTDTAATGRVAPQARIGGSVGIAMSVLELYHDLTREGPATNLDRVETGIAVASGVAGVVEGAATMLAADRVATIASRAGIAGAVAIGGVGVARGIAEGDEHKAVTAAGTVAAAFAGAKAGAVLGAGAGHYGALVLGAAGGIAGAMGFEAVMNISLRPAEMTAEQRAFFAFVDDLPTEVNAAMSEPLANLVRAKAGLVAANSNLHDALYKEALPQNPAIARKKVEAAQDQFEQVFDSLSEQDLAVAVANLIALRAPPSANEVVAGIPAHVAAMARGATAGQSTAVTDARDIPTPPQQFAVQASPPNPQQANQMQMNG